MTQTSRAAHALLVLSSGLAPAALGDVHVVDATGAVGTFVQIADAVAAAVDGDVILVHDGTYGGFTITDKSLVIVGDESGTRPVVRQLYVDGLSAGKHVALAHLNVRMLSSTLGQGFDAFGANDCDGALRIQDCSLLPPPLMGWPARGAALTNCDDAALSGCQVLGGTAYYDFHAPPPVTTTSALLADGSRIFTADTILQGRVGPCRSAVGAELVGGSSMFAAGGGMFGGDGDIQSCDCGFLYCGGDGGDGARIDSTGPPSVLVALATTFAGGALGTGTCDGFNPCNGLAGSPFTGAPFLPPVSLAGTPRLASHAAVVVDGSSLSLDLTGVVGDQVRLVLSKTPTYDDTAPGVGIRLYQSGIVDPALHVELPLGTLASASQVVAVAIPPLSAGAAHETWFAQTVFTDGASTEWFGPGRSVTVLPDGTTPTTDLCNGDGGDQMGCTACPCANDAPQGTIGGCLNSAGNSARLLASGDRSVSLPPGSSTDLQLDVEGAPPAAFCVLLSGAATAPTSPSSPCFGNSSGVQSALYDGLRCAVQGVRRHGGRATDANGDGLAPWGGPGNPAAGLATAAGFVPGQVRYFQVVNRENPLAVCMRGLNTTQAVEVVFTP